MTSQATLCRRQQSSARWPARVAPRHSMEAVQAEGLNRHHHHHTCTAAATAATAAASAAAAAAAAEDCAVSRPLRVWKPLSLAAFPSLGHLFVLFGPGAGAVRQRPSGKKASQPGCPPKQGKEYVQERS
eukprot:scaffold3920_cov134-Isochrysis_galbana.AAC.8